MTGYQVVLVNVFNYRRSLAADAHGSGAAKFVARATKTIIEMDIRFICELPFACLAD